MLPNSRMKAYLALCAVCFFWGTTYLGIRMSLESFPPFVLVATRFLLSGSILLAAARMRGARLPRGKELWQAAFSGVLILSIGNGCLTFAELWIPSGLAGLIVTLSPFWLVGVEALMGGERLHASTIFGSIVGYSSYAYALDRLPVAVVSIYPYVNSVVAVALGWLFYREPFGRREALAMLVIFAGVALVKWQSGKGRVAEVEMEA